MLVFVADDQEDAAESGQREIPEDQRFITLTMQHLSDGTWNVEVVDHEG
jgi:hypothetical protein